jgi:hypothetical protein
MSVRTLMLSVVSGFLFVSGPAASQSFDRAVELARKYTVAIRVIGTRTDNEEPKRYGSGVILRRDGYIATAGHVIGTNSEWAQGSDGMLKRTIEVRISDAYGYLEDRWRSAIVHKDGPSDVAIIKIRGTDFQRADCRSLREVRGTDIYRLGFAAGDGASWAEEKGGKTAVSDTPQDFQGNMISEKGMSGDRRSIRLARSSVLPLTGKMTRVSRLGVSLSSFELRKQRRSFRKTINLIAAPARHQMAQTDSSISRTV